MTSIWEVLAQDGVHSDSDLIELVNRRISPRSLEMEEIRQLSDAFRHKRGYHLGVTLIKILMPKTTEHEAEVALENLLTNFGVFYSDVSSIPEEYDDGRDPEREKLEEQIRKLEEKLYRLNARSIPEPADRKVIQFVKTFGNPESRGLTYVAVNIGGNWYLTGRKGYMSWTELLKFIDLKEATPPRIDDLAEFGRVRG